MLDTADTKLEDGTQAAEGPARDFVALARQMVEDAKGYIEAHKSKQWGKVLDHFRGKHPAGSKYHSDEYRARSKLFRPKTRSTVRRGEAACAAAFFSTMDVVNIAGVDDSDPVQRASAEVTHALVNRRLTMPPPNGIPWFLILQGAYQTAELQGVCVSKQYWEYREVERTTNQIEQDEFENPILDEEGKPAFVIERRVVVDRPVVKLIPPENMCISPGADWLNPIMSSPGVVERQAMYVADVKQRIADGEWLDVDDVNAYVGSRVDETSNIREKRSGYDPMDPAGAQDTIRDDEMVWCYECVRRVDGEDLHWWTLGEKALLTEPRPVHEVYPHLREGERPWTMGYGTLEAFTTFPASKAELMADLQTQANDIQNLRLDNVKQVLHPKALVKAGEKVDLRTITSGAPSSAAVVQDPERSVVYVRPPDVTGSSYQEHNYINVDIDEIAGVFSPGSVQTNRAMNETVGGMALLSNSANAGQEYDLRVFAETWVEPTLQQIVRMIQTFESDEVALSMAGRQSETLQGLMQQLGAPFAQYGIDPFLDQLLDQDLVVTVNVGIGSTDPAQRMQRFMGAMGALSQAAMAWSQLMGGPIIGTPGFDEMAKEIMGLAGYKDGKRFLQFAPPEDPRLQQAGQMVQQMQAQLEQAGQIIQQLQAQVQDKQADRDVKLMTEQMKQQGALQSTMIQTQGSVREAEINAAAGMQDTAQERVMEGMRMAAALLPQPMTGAI